MNKKHVGLCGHLTFGKYCSKCYLTKHNPLKGHHYQPMLGKTHSPENIEKMRQQKWGDKNPNWKGDAEINISALHQWLRRRLPKPLICPKCNERPTSDLANKGIYDRNLENWEWLCRKCHMESDGRMKNLEIGIKVRWVKRTKIERLAHCEMMRNCKRERRVKDVISM